MKKKTESVFNGCGGLGCMARKKGKSSNAEWKAVVAEGLSAQ